MESIELYTLIHILDQFPDKRNQTVCKRWAQVIAKLPAHSPDRNLPPPYDMPISWFHQLKSDHIFWIKLSRDCRLSTDFMIYFSENINWHNACYHQKIEEELIHKFPTKISYFRMGVNHMTPPECLFYVSDFSVWSRLSCSGNLPISVIEQYADKIDWSRLVNSQKLPEDIVIKYIDRIDWNIAKYHFVNEEFVKKINKIKGITATGKHHS